MTAEIAERLAPSTAPPSAEAITDVPVGRGPVHAPTPGSSALPLIVPAGLAATLLQACGGGSGGEPAAAATPAPAAMPPAAAAPTPAAPTPAPAPAPVAAPPPATPSASPVSETEAARFLLQAQLSASDADIAAVRAAGYSAWLQQQFAAPQGTGGWDWLNLRGYGAIDGNTRYYDASYPADYMLWNQLMTAPDGVRKRVTLALSEIFVVSLVGIDGTWPSFVAASWWDMLNAGAFGNFRALLENVTLHPAMGIYLNVRGSQKENAAGRLPDENYAREVMQLMTIGLVQLNADGSAKRGSDGAPLDTYTQSDITNLARVFTGYDFDQTQNVVTAEPTQNRNIGNTAFTRLPMSFRAALHSTLDVNFLGASISGTTDGPTERAKALDVLFNHANVGPFIGRQLIQRLVTSNPSPAYIARVSAAFANNGAGVRGDMRAVVAAVLLDTEARSPAGLNQESFGRLREPMLRLVQWGRTFGLQSARGSWKIGDLSNPATQLAQSPLRSPSVFNFFRPGYVPPSTALATTGAVAPEFQLVNESSVCGYLNFMQGVVRNGIFVNGPDLPQATSNANNGFDLTASYAAEIPLAPDAAALVARLNLLLCAGQLTDATVALIVGALNATPVTASSPADVKLNRIGAAVLLVMASAEYLVQK